MEESIEGKHTSWGCGYGLHVHYICSWRPLPILLFICAFHCTISERVSSDSCQSPKYFEHKFRDSILEEDTVDTIEVTQST